MTTLFRDAAKKMVTLVELVGFGHKIAFSDVDDGEPAIKYDK